jgi:hypothetical protein
MYKALLCSVGIDCSLRAVLDEMLRSELASSESACYPFDRLLVTYFSYHFHLLCYHTPANVAKQDQDEEEEEEQEEEEDEGDDNDDDDDEEEGDQQHEDEQQSYQDSTHQLLETCRLLYCNGAANLVSAAVMEVVFAGVSDRIKRSCAGKFDRPLLQRVVLQWLQSVVLPWSQMLLLGSDCGGMCNQPITNTSAILIAPSSFHYSQWVTRLNFFVYDSFASMRIDELFDIIVDFPDSRPALGDLKLCLQQTSLLAKLVASLTRAYVHHALWYRRIAHRGLHL